jgi:hypothetical protein
MKSLNSKHKAIARYLAMGADLRDVCRTYSLNYESWINITRSPLFKEEVARLERELEERMLQEISEDPVMQQLKVSALKAARTLDSELENYEKELGANASTRISASKTVLESAGYKKQENGAKSPSVIINLGNFQSELLKRATIVPEMPDRLVG